MLLAQSDKWIVNLQCFNSPQAINMFLFNKIDQTSLLETIKMGKLSKVLLNSLFLSSASADTFRVSSCNNENDDRRPPALTFRIAHEYFENNLEGQTTDSYDFIDGPDGGYHERTIQEDDLSLSFDTETDSILLSYTLAIPGTNGFQLNDAASIR